MTDTSEKRGTSNSRVTPARRVGDVRPMPIGQLNINTGEEPRERRMDAQSREAFERGRQAGLEEALAQARSQAEEELRQTAVAAGGFVAQRLEKLVAQFSSELTEMEHQLADQVVDLAVNLAKTIVADELSQHPEKICSVINECLRSMPAAVTQIKVRINPGDLQWIEQAVNEQSIASGLSLISDPDITAGGCRIESADANIDGTLATRWQRVLAGIGRESSNDV